MYYNSKPEKNYFLSGKTNQALKQNSNILPKLKNNKPAEMFIAERIEAQMDESD